MCLCARPWVQVWAVEGGAVRRLAEPEVEEALDKYAEGLMARLRKRAQQRQRQRQQQHEQHKQGSCSSTSRAATAGGGSGSGSSSKKAGKSNR